MLSEVSYTPRHESNDQAVPVVVALLVAFSAAGFAVNENHESIPAALAGWGGLFGAVTMTLIYTVLRFTKR